LYLASRERSARYDRTLHRRAPDTDSNTAMPRCASSFPCGCPSGTRGISLYAPRDVGHIALDLLRDAAQVAIGCGHS
jgi:hypothetical protein